MLPTLLTPGYDLSLRKILRKDDWNHLMIFHISFETYKNLLCALRSLLLLQKSNFNAWESLFLLSWFPCWEVTSKYLCRYSFFLFPPRALLFTLALSSKYVASKGYHCEADVKGTCAKSKSHVHLGSNLFKNYYGLISDIYAIAF